MEIYFNNDSIATLSKLQGQDDVFATAPTYCHPLNAVAKEELSPTPH